MAKLAKFLQGVAGAGGAGSLDVSEVFSTYLYEGNGSSTQTITNGIDLSGEGGLVWLKPRSQSNTDHHLYDTERGAEKILKSNNTDAETSLSTYGLQSFNSNGFTLGNSYGFENASGVDNASWTFRKAPKFFDVVTYTGDGVSGRTISHNLGCEVGCIIIKRLNSSVNDWSVYHRKANPTAPQNVYLALNNTNGAAGDTSYWNNTAPTDTVFTVGNGRPNYSGEPYVAYLFAHNDGDGEFGPDGDADIIKCGSYTGNGSDDGPTIDLGFEPQWLLVKSADQANKHWLIADVMRKWRASGEYARLRPHRTDAEDTANNFRPTATGFKVTATGSDANTSGGEYIYIAIRRGPMAVPTDATDVFDIAFDGALDTNKPYIRSDLNYVDMVINSSRTGTTYHRVGTRLTQGKYLDTNSTSAETTSSYYQYDFQNGWFDLAASNSINTNGISWMWKRAPNYFDVVAYTGTGITHTINHNLGVAPEMIWVKSRDSSSENWVVFHEGAGTLNNTFFPLLFLNSNSAATSDEDFTSQGMPTATSFTLNGTDRVNTYLGHDYIAYLFASLDGVSKVGSYTGNGTSQNIDCGFSSGARFVLIKRTNGTGNWHVFDTERGIVAGDDPRLELDTTDAEDTNDDYLDPYSSGFTVNYDGTFTTSINSSGHTYIFYAIA